MKRTIKVFAALLLAVSLGTVSVPRPAQATPAALFGLTAFFYLIFASGSNGGRYGGGYEDQPAQTGQITRYGSTPNYFGSNVPSTHPAHSGHPGTRQQRHAQTNEYPAPQQQNRPEGYTPQPPVQSYAEPPRREPPVYREPTYREPVQQLHPQPSLQVVPPHQHAPVVIPVPQPVYVPTTVQVCQWNLQQTQTWSGQIGLLHYKTCMGRYGQPYVVPGTTSTLLNLR